MSAICVQQQVLYCVAQTLSDRVGDLTYATFALQLAFTLPHMCIITTCIKFPTQPFDLHNFSFNAKHVFIVGSKWFKF